MANKEKKGFTLIELLIVIAIIGILASVIVVSLNSGRNRAVTASIKSSLKSVYSIAIQCRDMGSAIQVSPRTSGLSICTSGLVSGNFPSIPECGPNATDTIYTITNRTTDDWRISLSTCTGSSLCTDANPATPANAYCDKSGCYFLDSGTCK